MPKAESTIKEMKKIGRKLDAFHKRLLSSKWDAEISQLKREGEITFSCKQHKGKVRGRDIAKIFHRDLQKLGIKNQAIYDNNKGAKVILK